MARFGFRIAPLAWPGRPETAATAAPFRMMNVPDPDAAPGCSGWHESSRELMQGLEVIEGPPFDPLDGWFAV